MFKRFMQFYIRYFIINRAYNTYYNLYSFLTYILENLKINAEGDMMLLLFPS